MNIIPGNATTTFGRIYTDTTKKALEDHLRKVVQGQKPSMRNNQAYKAEVIRLRRAIAAR